MPEPSRNPLPAPIQDGRSAGAVHARRGRWIFLYREEFLFRERLSTILGRTGAATHPHDPDGAVQDSLNQHESLPGLIVIPIEPSCEALLEVEEALSRTDSEVEVPIIGLTRLDRGDLAVDTLRALGVVALIDKSTRPELIVSCAKSLLSPGSSRRRHVRAPCFVPVDVECDGVITTEYVENLSESGVQLAANRPLKVGQLLRMTLPLGHVAGRLISLSGCVVYSDQSDLEYASVVAGVVFAQVSSADRSELGREVQRLLESAPLGL